MATLLSLPTELLDHIMDDVHIDDFEAFCSCCKWVERLAATRLQEHLARKLRFPTVAIEPEDLDDENVSLDSNDSTDDLIPTSLLRDFLMDEKNALYPRSMSIDVDRNTNGNEKLLNTLVTTYLDQHHGLEDKIVAKIMQIQKNLYTELPVVDTQTWIDRIKKGDSDATAALLVTLFPNVKTLSMSYCPGPTDSLLIRTLERLTSSATKHGPRAFDTFRELSEIDLCPLRDSGANGKLIAMFMGLPSMRVIKGYGIDCFSDGWPYGVIASSVKKIRLESSQIESNHLTSCLKGMGTLERFTYDMVPIHISTIAWKPRLIVKTLRQCARMTLVHMELTRETRGPSSNLVDCEQFIANLRSFQVLESIRLMSGMLFKPVDEEDIDESDDTDEDILGDDLFYPTSRVEPRRLVDFLPSSAKRLALVGGISDETARAMFADLPHLKRERVPELGEIVLEESDPLERETTDLCRNAGVRLKSLKEVVDGYLRVYTVTRPAERVDGPER